MSVHPFGLSLSKPSTPTPQQPVDPSTSSGQPKPGANGKAGH